LVPPNGFVIVFTLEGDKPKTPERGSLEEGFLLLSGDLKGSVVLRLGGRTVSTPIGESTLAKSHFAE
jgi:hypothetical protein